MRRTKISWTDATWNPTSGCLPDFQCWQRCYARRMANRLKGRYGYDRENPFQVTVHLDHMEDPLKWKKPTRIFVSSMGDLFCKDVPRNVIARVLDVAFHAYVNLGHRFYFLTKRPERMHNEVILWAHMRRYSLEGIEGFWFGVSAENQEAADNRILVLLQIPVAHHFVSLEPLLGSTQLRPEWLGEYWLNYIPRGARNSLALVIAGGETGPGARPLHPAWVRKIRDDCLKAGVNFVFKSWGEWLPVGQKPAGAFKPIGQKDALTRFHPWNDDDKNVSMKVGHKAAGRTLDGKVWDEIPE